MCCHVLDVVRAFVLGLFAVAGEIGIGLLPIPEVSWGTPGIASGSGPGRPQGQAIEESLSPFVRSDEVCHVFLSMSMWSLNLGQ